MFLFTLLIIYGEVQNGYTNTGNFYKKSVRHASHVRQLNVNTPNNRSHKNPSSYMVKIVDGLWPGSWQHKSCYQQQQRKLFVCVSGVIDPRTETEISLDRAISLGIINQKEGRYVNPVTGESVPIPVAMNAGKIKVSTELRDRNHVWNRISIFNNIQFRVASHRSRQVGGRRWGYKRVLCGNPSPRVLAQPMTVSLHVYVMLATADDSQYNRLQQYNDHRAATLIA